MRACFVIGACVGLTLLVPGVAGGQSSSDPQATSPSGAIYEIPLESARKDAAPRHSRKSEGPNGAASKSSGGGGGDGSTGGGDGGESTYRSENNFGSSNQVPGASTPAGSVSGQSSSANGSEADRRSRSGAQLASAPPPAVAGGESSSGPEVWEIGLLIALLLAVGVVTAVLAIRARRRAA